MIDVGNDHEVADTRLLHSLGREPNTVLVSDRATSRLSDRGPGLRVGRLSTGRADHSDPDAAECGNADAAECSHADGARRANPDGGRRPIPDCARRRRVNAARGDLLARGDAQ